MHNINHLRSKFLLEKLGGDLAQGEVTMCSLERSKKKLTWAFIFMEESGWLAVKCHGISMKFLAPTTSFVPY